jgi:hypothetical protein
MVKAALRDQILGELILFFESNVDWRPSPRLVKVRSQGACFSTSWLATSADEHLQVGLVHEMRDSMN